MPSCLILSSSSRMQSPFPRRLTCTPLYALRGSLMPRAGMICRGRVTSGSSARVGMWPGTLMARIALPARIWRRKVRFRRNHVRNLGSGAVFSPEGASRSRGARNPTSGELLAPEGPSRTGSRRQPQLRRRFLAGGSIPAAWRRRRSQAAPRHRLRSPAENHRYHAHRAASVPPSFSPVRKSKSFS